MRPITQFAEYAISAVVLLAEEGAQRQTAHQIAARIGAPASCLLVSLRELVRHGIVSSKRGRHGGFELVRSPDTLSILDILEATKSPCERITSCPLGLQEHGQQLCRLHRRLDDVVGEVEHMLAKTTIADLLTEPNR